MVARLSFLFQMSTAPAPGTTARIHTGGWSESFWAFNPPASSSVWIQRLATARALLLPKTASIVGFRIAEFTIVQNKFKPVGSTSGKLVRNGNPAYVTDQPQCALSYSLLTTEGPNVSSATLRCVPDDMIVGGEYSPAGNFGFDLSAYLNEIVTGNWRFAGRKISNPTANIVGIAGNVVTVNANLNPTDNVSYVRFLNAKNEDGDSIIGTYLVTAHTATTLTLAGYKGGNMTVPSGKVRIDEVSTFLTTSWNLGRASVRKIGRPFENYRGRQSKTR